jgi:aspartate/tyrosine/aromatic aminotransferase
MTTFSRVEMAPPDPILGLTEAFKADTRDPKINLGVGVFVDDTGTTPVLGTVSEAERRLAEAGASKAYLPITGSPSYDAAARRLCFGDAGPDHVVTAQTPGGTGALRVSGDFLHTAFPDTKVWLSNPTWANHKNVFGAAGMTIESYPYFDAELGAVARDAMFDALRQVPAGDVVVLHACCHNPTGADLSASDWKMVAQIAEERGWLPLLDFAYQGFGDGIDEDAVGVRTLGALGLEFIVAQSFSKNFGLYQDRIGALHFVSGSAEDAAHVASQVKARIRANYSNPPAHGANIVGTILDDDELRTRWIDEVAGMRSRINGVRKEFVAALADAGVSRDFGFLVHQRGMFSFTGITKDQVHRLRDEHAVYMVDSGRINVAGITSKNLPVLVDALKTVLG